MESLGRRREWPNPTSAPVGSDPIADLNGSIVALVHADHADEAGMLRDGYHKGRAIAAGMASPAVEPVCHELLAGHERDIGQPAPVELLFLEWSCPLLRRRQRLAMAAGAYNMVSQSPDRRGENHHYGPPMRDPHRAR